MIESAGANALNHVIELCQDGYDFYSRAAERVEDAALSAHFKKMALVRSDIIAELKPVVEQSGASAAATGTVGGTLHRLLADFKARISKDETEVFLVQLEESENAVYSMIEDILADPLPEESAVKIEKIRAIFRSTRAQVADMGRRYIDD